MDSPPEHSSRHWRNAAFLAAAVLLPAGLNLSLYWFHNPLYGHGLWVLPLAALLLWRRTRGLAPDATAHAAPATAVIATALALTPAVRLVQIANPDWRLLDWLLMALAASALLALSYRLGGLALLRATWFPVAFLFTALPWSTALERAFTDRAVPATATVASELLWIGEVAAVDDGRMLHTELGPVEVSEDCSGIRGLQLAVMGALFWAGWLELRRGRAAALLGSALGLALLLNVLRVVAIVLAAQRAGRIDVAEELHDPIGTAAQLALIAALPLLALLLRGKSTPPAAAPSATTGLGWRAVPDGIALAAVLWVALGEAGAEAWFRRNERAEAAAPARWTMQRPARISGAKEEAVAPVIRRHYRYSDALSLSWEDRGRWSLLWMEFARGAQSACTHNVHRPEWCLPAQDFVLAKQFADLPVEAAGGAVLFHHQLYARHGALLNLFFTIAQDFPAAGARTWEDWTLAGRLRVAALGVRSQRLQMIHLTCAGALPALEARKLAAGYLGRVIVAAPPSAR